VLVSLAGVRASVQLVDDFGQSAGGGTVPAYFTSSPCAPYLLYVSGSSGRDSARNSG
jgi:hypothetical protein